MFPVPNAIDKYDECPLSSFPSLQSFVFDLTITRLCDSFCRDILIVLTFKFLLFFLCKTPVGTHPQVPYQQPEGV